MKITNREYMIDTHYPNLPMIEQGELEMRRVVGLDPLTPAEKHRIDHGLLLSIQTHARQEAEITRQASQSLAGAGFRNKGW